jgi:hypothetical protein
MILNFLISFFPSKQLYKQAFRRVETSDSSAMFFVGQALEDRGRRERLLKFMKFLGLEKSRCFPLFPLFSNGNSPIYMRNRKDQDMFSIFFLSCFYLFLFFVFDVWGRFKQVPLIYHWSRWRRTTYPPVLVRLKFGTSLMESDWHRFA